MIDVLSKTYANALIDSINEMKSISIKDGYIELKQIEKILNDDTISKFLLHPNIELNRKISTIDKSLKDFSNVVVSFIKVLVENKTIDKLQSICEAYEEYLDEIENVIRIEITSSYVINKDTYDKLIKVLENNYQKKVIVTKKLDKNIIGGIIVKRNGTIIDDSLLNKLKTIKDTVSNS